MIRLTRSHPHARGRHRIGTIRPRARYRSPRRPPNLPKFFSKTFPEHWAISRHQEQGLLSWTRSVLRSRPDSTFKPASSSTAPSSSSRSFLRSLSRSGRVQSIRQRERSRLREQPRCSHPDERQSVQAPDARARGALVPRRRPSRCQAFANACIAASLVAL
jgi:hypothetical protein